MCIFHNTFIQKHTHESTYACYSLLQTGRKARYVLLGRTSWAVCLAPVRISASACFWGATLEVVVIRGGWYLSPALFLCSLPSRGSLLSLGNADQHWEILPQHSAGMPSITPAFPHCGFPLDELRAKESWGHLHPSSLLWREDRDRDLCCKSQLLTLPAPL